MRYMMLVYSAEDPDARSAEEANRIRAGHQKTMAEAGRQGILIGAEPLAPTSTATTVRMRDGQAWVTDGPFAETKEQLAGYYILECQNLDEAIEWAAKIPTSCQGETGCIEIRPLRLQAPAVRHETAAESAAPPNG
jgi:hypothetical protein